MVQEVFFFTEMAYSSLSARRRRTARLYRPDVAQ